MALRRYIKWLREVDQSDVISTGGKSALLGVMIRDGLPVPPGFVVTVAAYRNFIEAHRLWPRIEQHIARLSTGDSPVGRSTIEEVSAAIADLFERSPVPEEIVSEVVASYNKLGGVPVAVRSSATAEDLPEASFAGQHSTYLNVRGSAELIPAIRRCWTSLWSARAIAYRLQRGISPTSLAMAVIVQELVDGDKSGVLFTADPANGRRDRILVNASWGLGEAVVGGAVTPDQWLVDKESGTILQTDIAKKTVMTVLRPPGATTIAVPSERQETAALRENEIGDLIVLARKTEALFGQPQDIEWVCGAGVCYLLQSRPITSLFPLPEPLPDPSEGLRIYVCGTLVGQTMVEPWTPMALDFVRYLYVGASDTVTGRSVHTFPRWVKTAAGRLFIDLTDVVRERKRWPLITLRISWEDPVAGRALAKLLERNSDLILAKGGGSSLFWPLARILPGLLARSLYAFIAPRSAMNRAVAIAELEIERLDRAADRLSGVEERLRFFKKAAALTLQLIIRQVSYILPGFVAGEAARYLMRRWSVDLEALHQVRQSLPHNPTTEMGLALLEIAANLKNQGERPSVEHPEVQRFLRTYGHRAVREIDLGVPRWQEEPSYVIDLLSSYMEMEGSPTDRIRKFHEGAVKAEDAINEIVSRVREKKGPFHAWLIERLLKTYRVQGGLRERPKFDLIRIFVVLRRVLKAVGADLVAQGRLDRADDVFFVTCADIESGVDLRAVAAKNRAEYERELRRQAVPRLMTSTGETVYGASEEETSGVSPVILKGIPASPGIYEGKVRILQSPRGARLEAGEILVAPGTDPAWTPLFLTAGALVMETGGPISHGAIVAREYGIPAVTGVERATTRLRDGQRVRVNGESGEVVPLEYETAA